MATDAETLRDQLGKTLAASDLPGLGLPTTDGCRDAYAFGEFTLLVVTDRLDGGAQTRGAVPFKGEVTTRMATWWLDVTGDLAPSPVERVLDPQALLARRAEPLCRIGAWTRLSRGLWAAYDAGLREVAGVTLPNGLQQNDVLDQPLITTVDDTGAPIPPLTTRRFEEARDLAGRLFARGCQLATERGVTLVDTLYSFGELDTGQLGNVDLLHGPHVSTYWRDGRSLHEADIVSAWRERADGAIKLEGELPSVVLVEIARAYLELGELFIADFTPTTGRAINRLSFSLSAAGLLA